LQNNHNTRYAAAEHGISAANVGKLKPKWVFTATGVDTAFLKNGARAKGHSPRQPTSYARELVADTPHPLVRRHHQHERIPTQRRRL